MLTPSPYGQASSPGHLLPLSWMCRLFPAWELPQPVGFPFRLSVIVLTLIPLDGVVSDRALAGVPWVSGGLFNPSCGRQSSLPVLSSLGLPHHQAPHTFSHRIPAQRPGPSAPNATAAVYQCGHVDCEPHCAQQACLRQLCCSPAEPDLRGSVALSLLPLTPSPAGAWRSGGILPARTPTMASFELTCLAGLHRFFLFAPRIPLILQQLHMAP